MEFAALALSGLSLIVAIVGTVLSNRRSSEAVAESRKAAIGSRWSDALTAVQRFIGFDPMSEPVGDRLTNLRIATIELVDSLDDWRGFDVWLDAERTLGACLGHLAMKRATQSDTVEQRLEALAPYQQWAQALGHNLRKFRNQGYDEAVAKQLGDHALDQIKKVCKANGWSLPPTTI